MQPLLAAESIDLARMRSERFARLQAEMESSDVDALVAIGLPNVQYAVGNEVRAADSARCHYDRATAIVFRGEPHAHVFTSMAEGLPSDLPEEYRHDPLHVEFDAGVDTLAEFVRRRLPGLPGAPSGARVAIDEYTAALFGGLAGALAGVEILDGSRVFGAARLCKTRDELSCIRRAQQINEQAMRDVLPLVRPGVRQNELTARFLRRIHELGASANEIDPIWQVMAPSLAANPFSVGGDVPFPRTTTDRFLREGDVLWVDTGITVHGYASDFGRTWIVGREPRPTAAQQAQFERWRDVVARVVESVRPGVTGLELVRIATAAEPTVPWMNHFYLIHGVGLNSAEMPLIGTDLGEDFDDSIVLEPGMVLVLEPAIWQDGSGGYRSEEVLAVTDRGCVFLSDFPYDPFEGTGAQ